MEYRNKKIEFIKHVQDTIKYEGPEVAIKVINHELKAVKNVKNSPYPEIYEDQIETLNRTKKRIQSAIANPRNEKGDFGLKDLFNEEKHIKKIQRILKKHKKNLILK